MGAASRAPLGRDRRPRPLAGDGRGGGQGLAKVTAECRSDTI